MEGLLYGNARKLYQNGWLGKQKYHQVCENSTLQRHYSSESMTTVVKSSQLTVIGFKIIEFITVMALVQKCKQGEKNLHQRLRLNCFTKNHGEMKGIIQMTILEPLVHLYQKLRRCCRHNNIKIFFFSVLLFYLQGLEGTFFPLNFILLQQ